MGFIRYSVYKMKLASCTTLEEVNATLDKAIENKSDFTPYEKLLLAAYSIQKIKKIAGVK